jgi:hypothetical protein
MKRCGRQHRIGIGLPPMRQQALGLEPRAAAAGHSV